MCYQVRIHNEKCYILILTYSQVTGGRKRNGQYDYDFFALSDSFKCVDKEFTGCQIGTLGQFENFKVKVYIGVNISN